MSGRKFAILFDMFGPYHLARVNALGSCSTTLGLEVAARSGVYQWDTVRAAVSFDRQTLFDVNDSAQISYAATASAVDLALSRFRPDAVLVPGWATRGALAALTWCLANRTPAVVMSESTGADHARFGWKEELKRQIVTCFQSGFVGGGPQKTYLASLGMDGDAIALGYNVVDNAYFEERSRKARAEGPVSRARLGLPDRYFLASARFVSVKNLVGLLEAFSAFRSLRPDTGARLVLIGDGEQRAELEATRSRLRLDDEVIFPGFVQYDELPSYYGLADGFIHVSQVEPWGLVVNEAMACGLPVIVSRECGSADTLVRDGANGFIVPYDGPGVIAERLARLDDDPKLRGAMGARSRQIVSEWSPARFGRGASEALSMALARGPRHPTLAQRAVLGLARRRVSR